jgi:integrase
MASITKDAHDPPKSPYWIACFNGIGNDGRVQRFKITTKTTDKKLAQELANLFEAAVKHAGRGQLTASHARKVIQQMYELAMGESLPFDTTRDYLEKWLEGIKDTVDENTLRCYQTSVTGFLEHLGAKAKQELKDITPTDILSWRNALKAKGLSAPTVNGHLRYLRIPFNRAHDLGYIPVNVCGTKAVPPIKDDTDDIEKDTFSVGQVAALIKAAPSADWAGLITCGAYTGLRLRDCSDLEWGNVDLDKQVIKVKPHKTRRHGTVVTVPIHPSFMAWLRKQTRGIGKAPVFPTLFGTDTGGTRGLSATFKRIMARAKVKGRLLRKASGEGRSRSSLSFHSLRHSFVSGLANVGVDAQLRQALAGHSSTDQSEHYTHRALETLRAAVLKLPGIPQGKTKAR